MNQPIDPFDIDDSGFEEVQRSSANQGLKAPVIMSTMTFRGKNPKISLNFGEEVLAKLDGWPRFNIRWNKNNHILRIIAATGGAHEAGLVSTGKPSKTKRYTLRIPLQEGLKHVEKIRQRVEFKYALSDNKTINLLIPEVFRIVYARPGVPAPMPGEKLTPERLRALEPAPNYGTKRG